MCGIAGILDLASPIDPGTLDRFTDALAHRGPDGRGTWIGPGIGLGHRRLSILDLSEAGACPMRYQAPDGRVFRITYNGEIYNFLELRAELEAKGHRFRNQTDTEVFAAAYAEWGRDCLLRFNGMWAVAIWEESSRELFLARDRFGVKPLHYTAEGGRFAFASEIKAFPRLDGFRPSLDEEIVPLALERNQTVEGSTDRCLMRGVRKLMPGHWLSVDAAGRIEIRAWWRTSEHLVELPEARTDRVERFRELFLDAVRLRMRSDVPIGTCLSGGLDSSSVASAMAWLHRRQAGDLDRCSGEWRQAFVASFPGTAVDETEFALEVVRHAEARERIWTFDPEASLKQIPASVWAMEDIYPGIASPVWALYREMRRAGVFVSLDGHGGDELLGGYTWYLDVPMGDLGRVLDDDFHRTLLPSILRNYDRCSMAHGIEVRMPLMDWRLVVHAFSLPSEDKIGGGFTKRILRDATAGMMPESIRTRRSKIGFNAPMIEWFNGGLLPLVHETTSHPLWLESPWWDGTGLRRQILDRCARRAWHPEDWDLSMSMWLRMNLVLWCRMFIEGRVPEVAP